MMAMGPLKAKPLWHSYGMSDPIAAGGNAQRSDLLARKQCLSDICWDEHLGSCYLTPILTFLIRPQRG